MPKCGCYKKRSNSGCNDHHQNQLNPCSKCNTNWEGLYSAEGFTYLLNKDGTVTTTAATRNYLITKVGDHMYKVVMNNLTPEQFTFEFLFFKKDKKLYSSSNGGVDIISCEGKELVADFSNAFLNGRFILTPILLDA